MTISSYVSGVWLGRNVSSGQYEVDLVSLFARPPSKLSIPENCKSLPDSLNFDSKKLRNHNFSVSQPPPSWLDFITRSFQPSVWSQSLWGHSGSDCIWRKGRQQWYVYSDGGGDSNGSDGGGGNRRGVGGGAGSREGGFVAVGHLQVQFTLSSFQERNILFDLNSETHNTYDCDKRCQDSFSVCRLWKSIVCNYLFTEME